MFPADNIALEKTVTSATVTYVSERCICQASNTVLCGTETGESQRPHTKTERDRNSVYSEGKVSCLLNTRPESHLCQPISSMCNSVNCSTNMG